jgi:arylsulfatase A-like enzyme
MNKIVIIILAILFHSCAHQPRQPAERDKPNILFLLADDLGYGELGCYGQDVIKTPVIDELAKQGIRFTDFYAGSPLCSPSRAVIMTGKHSGINTIRGNIGYYPEQDRYDRVPLGKNEITLGEMMRGGGYQTAYIGKWHLDDPCNLDTWAYNRGFDFAVHEQWGSCSGGIPYDEEMHWINGKQDSVYYDSKEYDCKDEFRTNIAIDYLEKRDKERPFFLFMSYRAPHANEKYIRNKELYSGNGWPEKERMHAAKITLLDKQIGRLLSKLEEMGELDNTLVIFTSDNGPHAELEHDHEFFDSNGVLRGLKRDTYEGGIRVPAIAVWKGKIKSGTVSDFQACGQDFMPTFAELAGIEPPAQTNGVSFLPVLTGESPKSRSFLSWEFHSYGMEESNFRQAVRIGNMKGVRYGVNSKTELYDLDNDISENSNIASQHPDLVKKIEKIFEEEHAYSEHYPYGGYKRINRNE